MSAAGAFVSVTAKLLDLKISAVKDFPDNILELKTTFGMLVGVVEDAERTQVITKVDEVWVSELKDIAYAVDDLLDDWNTEMLREKKREKQIALAGKVRKACLSATATPASVCKNYVMPFFSSEHIVIRVNEILKRLRMIASAHQGLRPNNPIEFQSSLGSRPDTSSFIDTKGIYGRENDREIILRELLRDRGSEVSHASVISIVGTGGFGKTALSQLVFNDNEVISQFFCSDSKVEGEVKKKMMWVCVSRPVDWNKVVKNIIIEAGGEVSDSDVWQSLHKRLNEAVKDKKFFLVLDDVWEYNDSRWRDVKLSLDGGSQGSIVLVTTREESIARRMGSSFTHRLEGLSDNDCWELFQSRALQGKEELEWFEKIEDIGKKLSRKCRGVPLAAVLLSSHMSLKISEQDWEDVLDSNIWELTKKEDKEGVWPELLLSYYALPYDMKQCFVYCAMFPEDMAMRKDYVIKLWMAEGFIADNGKGDLEKIGAGYFDELAMRSFFQDFTMDNGNLVKCKMHDIVRGFALILMHSSHNYEKMEPMRYLHSLEEKKEPSSEQLESLRTLVHTRVTSLQKSVCLRVLHLTCCGTLDQFPQKVDQLFHLRYLGLNELKISELPDSVCDLLNLQTLNLDKCCNLKRLPDRIGELSNLRHLQLEETDELENMPESIEKLSLLRTLNKFIVGAESNSLKIGALKLLSHLQGSLEILGLENIANLNEVSKDALKMKVRSVKFDFNIKSHISLNVGWRGKVNEAMKYGGLFEDEDEDEDEDEEDEDDRHTQMMERILTFLKDEDEDDRRTQWQERILKLLEVEDEDRRTQKMERILKLLEVEDEDRPTQRMERILTLLEDEYVRRTQRMEKILTLLEPPEGLKELEIRSYPGRTFPFWISSLSNLAKLQLFSCKACVKLPCLGNLAFLEDITLSGFPSVELLEKEFYGVEIDNKELFPRLKKLVIIGMTELTEWKFPSEVLNTEIIMPRLSTLNVFHCTKLTLLPYQAHDDVFPALSDLHIAGCGSQLLTGAQKLKSLKNLHLEEFTSSECLDKELSEISKETKLESLTIQDMENWKEWSLPSGTDVFSNLVYLQIVSCQSLVKLPALGGLKSLKILSLRSLESVTSVDKEFLGMSDSNDQKKTSFPELQSLEFLCMSKLLKWEVPFEDEKTELFPKLTKLEIKDCDEMLELPALGKLNSLEELTLLVLPQIKPLGTQLLGISSNADGARDVRFPKLTRLWISGLVRWETENGTTETGQGSPMETENGTTETSQGIPMETENDTTETGQGSPMETENGSTETGQGIRMETENGTTETGQGLPMEIMPCLEELSIMFCTMLKAIPSYMFSTSLKNLVMTDCPKLSETQPCLPSRLENLNLQSDLGKFSTSLPVKKVRPSAYQQLTDVKLCESKCKVLPKGFDQFTAIQKMEISECDNLDFQRANFNRLENLQELSIDKCRILSKSCIEGENWGTTSRIPKIYIDGKQVKATYRTGS